MAHLTRPPSGKRAAGTAAASALALALAAGAAGVNAASPSAPAASAPVAQISEEQARAIALRAVTGKVTDVAIEKKMGRKVYTVEIRTPDDRERDVFVDVANGQVLGVE